MRKSKHILRTNRKPRALPFLRCFDLKQPKIRHLSVISLLLLVSACATTTPIDSKVPSEPVEASASAAALMKRAASAPADRAAALYLQAAWAYLETSQPDASSGAVVSEQAVSGAMGAFTALEPGWLDAELLPDYQLLTAALAVRQNELDTARTAMAGLSTDVLNAPRALRISSALCAADGDYDCALRARIAAAGDDPTDNEPIWKLLNRSLTLSATDQNASADNADLDQLPGWLSLQSAVVTPFSLEASREAVREWLTEHPEHPAALIPPVAVTRLLNEETEPVRVALLLPLSGPLARAGESVRDGFITASISANSANWLTITVYDSAAEPIPILYERMLAEGADLVVGPLQKSAVTTLSELNPELPVLALNYLDEGVPTVTGFSQFGLAIEDEARTIARRLQADGVTRALLFHNYDDWSLRARRTLTENADGTGLALTVQPFTDLRTITEAVGSAMHVAGSQSRRDELARLLGEELEFLPRAREDVDAVVALIDNTEANALVPALRFHFADHLPIYASSQTTRRARAGSLAELRGFHVSELPWFLAGDRVFAELAEPFDLDNNPFASLMALGSDAYRLTERMSPEAEVVLLGSTGLLRQQADGRVVRELAWGTIAGGKIQGTVAPPDSATGAGD